MNERRGTFPSLLAPVAAACVLTIASAAAQGPVMPPRAAVAPAAPAPAGAAALTDTAALGAFLDGTFAPYIDQLHVAGAVVSVVKDGRVLYAKGYGYSNVDKKTPVSPATSLFRIGSTSKLFTWTAIMQLVEQGKVNLDADVNTYLKNFQIPAKYGKPVTVRSLMTHSSGFEDGALGYPITNDSNRVQPIDVTLKQHMPARVRPTDELSSYSNYGAALAGLSCRT